MAGLSQKVALQCLGLLLRPVARFCIRNSLTVRELLEASKVALIDAATHEMERSGEKVNISRLSVITGIHRRDVMRLSREGPELDQPTNLVSRIIGQWEQDPHFRTKTGKPRVLTTEGDDNEFRAMVARVSQDLNAGTVLFQLERIGAIERTKNGVKLKKRAHSVQHDVEEGYKLLSSDVDDLIIAVGENLEDAGETPHLHARTEYDNIYVSALPEVRTWLLDKGSEFHEKVRNYLAQFDQDINPERGGKAKARVMVGTFSLAVEPETEQ